MPFKIVQTKERGKKYLSCVPSAWEDSNVLLWPRNGSKKLQKSEESQPQVDWISIPCKLKRSNLSYDEAQVELLEMQLESETEDERVPKRHREIGIIDANQLAEECIWNKENFYPNQGSTPTFSTSAPPTTSTSAPQTTSTSTSAPQTTSTSTTVPSTSSTNFSPPITSASALTSSTSVNTNVVGVITTQDNQNQDLSFQQGTESGLFWLNPPNELSYEDTVGQRLSNIENTQRNILLKLSELSTEINAFIKLSCQQKQAFDVGFKQIDSHESLRRFAMEVENQNAANTFKQKLSTVCGSGRGRGINNSFALVDIMFTRKFLTECSWAGGSRDETKKICFKAYTQVINFFFEIIHESDNSFTLLDCETFFKNILKNSTRRNASKMQRASTSKLRAKKRRTISDTNSNVQSSNTVSLPEVHGSPSQS